MAAIAVQILHQHFRAVRLERNTVIAIVDHTVLNYNIRAPVCIPAIRVLRSVVALAVPTDADIRE